MKRRWAVAACLVVGAFALSLGLRDKRAAPLIAYRHVGDALASLLPLSVFDIYPCAKLEKIGKIEVIAGIPTEKCFKMLPAQLYRGIWLDEFEGSRFFQGASDAQDVREEISRHMRSRVPRGEWLDWSQHLSQSFWSRDLNHSRLIAVEFIGRRAAYAGSYGHLGGSRSFITVDRLVSARLIYTSREAYFEDEVSPRR